MKKHVGDIIGCAGVALLSFGVGMLSRPAGIIVLGAALVLLALFGFGPEKRAGN
jgi:4-amino-4-deoxy-L-arabinose transferase-like glycosyltransferase